MVDVQFGLGEGAIPWYNGVSLSFEMGTMRKRLVRREEKRPLRLQGRDMELLQELGEYRFLDTSQILALHPGGRRNSLRRLAAMFDLGYLDRPRGQSRSSSPHIAYSLGREGVRMIYEEQSAGMLRRLREIERSLPLIAHTLMISQFRVCLTLALRKREDVQLRRWLQGYDLKAALRRHGRNPELVPDAFFVLHFQEYEYPVFLEADRGTMSAKRFTEKLKIYWKWWEERRIQETLNFTHFRVITITPTEARSEHLRIAAKDADRRQHGSNMFLFASEKSYSIPRPGAIFDAVWKSPKDDLQKTIL
ncbi:replication-relaxation family protein [Patescibacteria group bacterium]|nr:replication-relaxation family protein [Patescibacteria group bacterium]